MSTSSRGYENPDGYFDNAVSIDRATSIQKNASIQKKAGSHKSVHRYCTRKGLGTVVLILMLVGLFSTGVMAAKNKATTIRLVKTEGDVTVTNSKKEELVQTEDMRLYSGDHQITEDASYAWMSLDGTKAVKLDENSESELRKKGKKLEVLLDSGSIFFNVKAPLESDETLNIRSSTMITGIRGTCGWVRIIDSEVTRVYLLEGSLDCAVTNPVSGETKKITLKPGQYADFYVYDAAHKGDSTEIKESAFAKEDIEPYVLVELLGDTPLINKIYEQSGIDLRDLKEGEVRKKLVERQQAKAAEKEQIRALVLAQDCIVSKDPVWNEERALHMVADHSIIYLTMPQTATTVQRYLDDETVKKVVLLPGEVSEEENTLKVDIEFETPAAKTLEAREGVFVRVLEGKSFATNGTSILQDELTNYGKLVVNSANTLRTLKKILNHGLFEITATGRALISDTIVSDGTFRTAGVVEAEEGVTGDTMISILDGEFIITDGTIISDQFKTVLGVESGEQVSLTLDGGKISNDQEGGTTISVAADNFKVQSMKTDVMGITDTLFGESVDPEEYDAAYVFRTDQRYHLIALDLVDSYPVVIVHVEHGTISAPGRVEVGATVPLAIRPDEGYELESLSVSTQSGGAISLTASHTFVMPKSNVTVTGSFKEIQKEQIQEPDENQPEENQPEENQPEENQPEENQPEENQPAENTTQPETQEAPSYSISTSATNGTVRASANSAKSGERITLILSANAGYEFESLSVSAGGKNVGYTVNGGNYEFVMPAENVTVNARFKANTYTVTWQNEDGSVLRVDGNVARGTIPSYGAAAPTKASDAKYSYSFRAWSDGTTNYNVGASLPAVTGNVTYRALFVSTVNQYQVTFVDEDGTTILKSAVSYDYDTAGALIQVPADPAKAADAQYTYTFSGWTDGSATYASASDFPKVTGNVTYKAVYGSTVNKYNVTFVDEDGSILRATTAYNYGLEGSAMTKPSDPTKAADVQYTYAFGGWSDGEAVYATADLPQVTKDITYTATYTAKLNSYTVTFVDDDGTVLKAAKTYDYGTAVAQIELPADPTKAADETYIYTFTGWTPAVTAVSGDVTYRATYSTANVIHVTGVSINEKETGLNLMLGGTESGTLTATVSPGDATNPKVAWSVDDASILELGDATGENGSSITVTALKTGTATITVTTEDGLKTDSMTITVGAKVTGVSLDKSEATVILGKNESLKAILAPTDATEQEITWSSSNEDIATVAPGEADPKTAIITPHAAGTATITVTTTDGGFTATCTVTVKGYTVTFKNTDEEQTTLETQTNVAYGDVPVYGGATPKKSADAQYTYTFKGWSDGENEYLLPDVGEIIELAEVEGNVTYTALYDTTINTYTLTWKNADGTVLQTLPGVPYGSMIPEYDGEEPAKAGDAQYSYTFAGWDKNPEIVTGDETFTATFSSSVNTYKITWVNEGGATLETDSAVEYGETPSYDGEEPYKAATAQYDYKFAGWTPAIATVTGDATYTAQYTSTVNTYTVTWKNEDGTVLETDEDVPYGTVPSYDGEAPTKTATAQYTYTFVNWDQDLLPVTGNVTYTATYGSTVNTYAVTWKNEDGTVLETDSAVAYGTVPSYDSATPVKTADAQYTYTFKGWNDGTADYLIPENGGPITLPAIAGDTVFTAVYGSTVNTYTVTWNNADGTLLKTDEGVAYGTVPVYGSNDSGSEPALAQTEQYTYTFKGWMVGNTGYDKAVDLPAVTGDVTITAEYVPAVRSYTITFYQPSTDTVGELLSEQTMAYGADIIYEGEAPIKTSDNYYTYAFEGWNNAEGNAVDLSTLTVTGPASFYARYQAMSKNYAVTLNLNAGGDTSAKINAGDVTEYTYSTADAVPLPTDVTRTGYDFRGWYCSATATVNDPSITAIAAGEYGDKTFYALWEAQNFSVTLDLNDSDIPNSNATINEGNITGYTYGVGVALPTDVTMTGYRFDGWFTSATPEATDTAVIAISATDTGAKTYYAKWTMLRSITLNTTAAGGTLTADKTEAEPGDTVTLTLTPDEGYKVKLTDPLTATPSVTFTKGAETTANVKYTFTMPDGNVTVTAAFSQEHGIEVISIVDIPNGATSLDKTTAIEGETVTITATPDEHFVFAEMLVSYLEGGEQVILETTPVTGETGKYTFTMPDAVVSVAASYMPEIYTVNFDLNEHGTAIASQEIAYRGNIETPETPSEAGYTFGGWYKEAACMNAWDFENDTVLGDTTLYAKWTPNAIAGRVNITGEPKVGETLTASMDYTGIDPNVGTLTYTWKNEAGEQLATGTGNTYEIKAADLGSKITCVVTSSIETGEKTAQTATVYTTYAITMSESIANGTVTARVAGEDVTEAKAGDSVTIIVKPDGGYELTALSYVAEGASSGVEISLTDMAFTMPAANVTISATFSESEENYAITIPTTENGTVAADKETAAAGSTVTLTTTPDNGYGLKSLLVNTEDGAASVAITPDVSMDVNEYTFQMPDGAVEVSAVFDTVYTFTYEYMDGYELVSSSDGFSFMRPHFSEVPTGGVVSADRTKAFAGDTITLSITPDTYYILEGISAGYYDEEELWSSLLSWYRGSSSALNNSFTMPANDVTVSAEFSALTTYNINYTYLLDGGTITADQEVAVSDSELGFTVQANTGYTLQSMYITGDFSDASSTDGVTSRTITVVGAAANLLDSDGHYTLDTTGLKGDLQVKAEFVKDQTRSIQLGTVENATVNVNIGEIQQTLTATESASVQVGAIAELVIVPDDGYRVKEVQVKKGTEDVTVSEEDGSFAMPDGDITISVVTENMYSISAGTVPTGIIMQLYADEDLSTELTEPAAAAGDDVYVKLNCEDGLPGGITVTNVNGIEPLSGVTVELVDRKCYDPSSNGFILEDDPYYYAVYHFVMPAQDVQLNPADTDAGYKRVSIYLNVSGNSQTANSYGGYFGLYGRIYAQVNGMTTNLAYAGDRVTIVMELEEPYVLTGAEMSYYSSDIVLEETANGYAFTIPDDYDLASVGVDLSLSQIKTSALSLRVENAETYSEINDTSILHARLDIVDNNGQTTTEDATEATTGDIVKVNVVSISEDYSLYQVIMQQVSTGGGGGKNDGGGLSVATTLYDPYTFTMPDQAVIVTVSVLEKGNPVSIGSMVGGTATATPARSGLTKVKNGETVTVNVTPEEGLTVDTVSLTGADGSDLGSLVESGETVGTYVFAMPDQAVTFTATFKAAATGAKVSLNGAQTLENIQQYLAMDGVSGIVLKKNGTAVADNMIAVASDETLVIPAGYTFEVQDGVYLKVDGTMTIASGASFTNGGVLANQGTITVGGTDAAASFTNTGTIGLSGSIVTNGGSKIVNHGRIVQVSGATLGTLDESSEGTVITGDDTVCGTCGDAAYYYAEADPDTSGKIRMNVIGIGSTADYSFSSYAISYTKYRQTLKSIVFEDGITRIGDNFVASGDFRNPFTSLTTVQMADTITEIGSYVFYYAPITGVALSSSLKTIGSYAFEYCDKLESITIPASCTKISKYAFYYSGLKNISIPDSVTSIGERAFQNCTSLESVVIGEGISSLNDDFVFSGCTKLTSLSLPDSLVTMYIGTFSGCTSLTEVVIPKNFRSFYGNHTYGGAFDGCTNLTTVRFEDTDGTLQSIGESVFENCNKLSTIYYGGTPENWSNVNISSTDNATLLAATVIYYNVNSGISYDVTSEGGTVEASVNGTALTADTEVSAGQKVTLSVTANTGYELSALQVTKTGNEQVAVTVGSDGSYSFDMPAGAVTVKATFVETSSVVELTEGISASSIQAAFGDATGKTVKISADGTIDADLTITGGDTLVIAGEKNVTIAAGVTLTVASGAILTNFGTLTNNGTIDGSGTINNFSSHTINNYGTILIGTTGSFANGDGAGNDGRLCNFEGGLIVNGGSFVNAYGSMIENDGVIETAEGAKAVTDGFGAYIGNPEVLEGAEAEGEESDEEGENAAAEGEETGAEDDLTSARGKETGAEDEKASVEGEMEEYVLEKMSEEKEVVEAETEEVEAAEVGEAEVVEAEIEESETVGSETELAETQEAVSTEFLNVEASETGESSGEGDSSEDASSEDGSVTEVAQEAKPVVDEDAMEADAESIRK